jgi:hypothetical protein
MWPHWPKQREKRSIADSTIATESLINIISPTWRDALPWRQTLDAIRNIPEANI